MHPASLRISLRCWIVCAYLVGLVFDFLGGVFQQLSKLVKGDQDHVLRKINWSFHDSREIISTFYVSRKQLAFFDTRTYLTYNTWKLRPNTASRLGKYPPLAYVAGGIKSRASTFVLVAKPWTGVAKPWEDWWRVQLTRGFAACEFLAGFTRSRIPPAMQANPPLSPTL